MVVDCVHVLVEEPSMAKALEVLLPKMLRMGITFEVKQFQCKDELLKRLPERLRGYADWLPETTVIVVVVDRDDEDCKLLKQRLESMATAAGLSTKSTLPDGRFRVVNRIAIEELESWFFGDWEAVRAAYPKLDENTIRKEPFRDPDAIKGGTWEALERVLQSKGYFKQGLRKMELARTVALQMEPARNRSASFMCLRDVLQQL